MRVTFATEPAHPGKSNEDFVGATPDALVLLDGAGTPAGMESGCSHTVAWYASTLGSILLSALVTDTGPLTGMLADGIEQVASLHEDTCDLTHPGSPSATVALLRHTGDTLDWLALADSVILLDTGTTEPTVICDDRLEHIGRPLRASLNALPGGTPEHVAALRDYIETMRSYRNRANGFWVASVDPLAASHALTGSLAASGVKAAAVLSDGASRLVDLFALSTWQRTLDLLRSDGPATLIHHVREAERSDPRCARWPRGKPLDDATAAYCRL